ncbi:MucBP domain-containing protein [Lactococcus lactis]|nr:MucBP domain-containing protein [Lactococcus lactis]
MTYVYTKNPVPGKNVTVKYLDDKGQPIPGVSDVILTGNVGENYTTDKKDISGYTFKEIQGSATGSFTDQEQTVTYVYTKNPVPGKNVTVKYLDDKGQPIPGVSDVILTGNVGENYTTDKKDISGYTFKEIQGSATGSFTDQEQTVTYVYTKNPVPGKNVTVKYLDDKGQPIPGVSDVILTGNVGENYTTDKKDISGYTFKEIQGSATGSFTDQEQTVTYVYTKNPVPGKNVTVKYLDDKGQPIPGVSDVILTGNVGENYTTDKKDISGYTFKEIQGSATGSFTDQEQTVTYVYTKNPVPGKNVTVKYLDDKGQPIPGVSDVILTGNVGENYTTDKKDIFGYTFKEIQGSATGSFTDQEQTVTYVYTKNPVPESASSNDFNKNNKASNIIIVANSKLNDSNIHLPKTGDNSFKVFATMSSGISILSLGLLLFILRINKSKNK